MVVTEGHLVDNQHRKAASERLENSTRYRNRTGPFAEWHAAVAGLQVAKTGLYPNVDNGIEAYFRQINEYPLLTISQEQTYGAFLVTGREAKVKLESSEQEPTSERRILEEQVRLGEEAKKIFILSNLKLVVSIAKRYGDSNALLNRIQEGNMGLMKATDKYDSTRGFKFSTHATWWIRQAVKREVATHGQPIYRPQEMVNSIKNLRKAEDLFRKTHTRRPTNQELADATGLTAERIAEIRAAQMAENPLSFQQKVGSDTDTTLEELTVDPKKLLTDELAISSLERKKKTEDIHHALDVLSDLEQQVLRLIYRIDENNPDQRDIRAYTEVARMMGITSTYVSELAKRGARKMKVHMSV